MIPRIPIRKTWSVTPIRIGKRRIRGQVGRVGVVDGEEPNPQELLEEWIDAAQSALSTAAHDGELTLAYDNTVIFGGQVVGTEGRKSCAERGAVANVKLLRERPGGCHHDGQRDARHQCEPSLKIQGSVALVGARLCWEYNFPGLQCCDGVGGGCGWEECVPVKGSYCERK